MRVGRGGRRVAAELGLESEPGTRKEESPTGGAHLSVAERSGVRTGPGEGEQAAWVGPCREKKKERVRDLGWA